MFTTIYYAWLFLGVPIAAYYVYIRKEPIFLSPTRSNIYWRDAHKCQYCYEKFPHSKLTLDHVIPKSKGGDKSWGNLVTCCSKCNQKKGSKTPEEANMKLLRVPTLPRFNVLRTKPHVKIPFSWKRFI